MKYELLNNISGAAVLMTVTLAFTMLFESRYPKRRYLSSLIPFLCLLLPINLYVMFRLGFAAYGKYTVILATIPSLCYFFLVSRHRDGRFFFTFCLVDTVSIWFALAGGLLDYGLGCQGILNFVIRLAAMPAVLFLIYRYARKPFLSLLHTVRRGWWLFTAMTGLVYAILIVVASVPCSIRQRPQDIPLAVLILLFLPLTYAAIFYVLFSQQKLFELQTQERTLSLQTSMIHSRFLQLQDQEEQLRIARHDLRHQINLITELAHGEDREQLLQYLSTLQQGTDSEALTHYCTNPVLDAILNALFRQAQAAGIQVETHLSIPDSLPVPEEELAIVFANALENAIHAAGAMPPQGRKIQCTCIQRPTLMLEIRNTYQGTVRFDSQGLPLARDPGHGMGTHSISAFCQKHDATCIYDADGTWFRLMISL